MKTFKSAIDTPPCYTLAVILFALFTLIYGLFALFTLIYGLALGGAVSGCGGTVGEPMQTVTQAQCVPNTSCGQSTCGVLPDGCGGTFSCGVCNTIGTATVKGTLCYFPIGTESPELLDVAPSCHGELPVPDVDAIAKDDPRCALLVHACE
jgi:hypothetical protein